jgi:methyl-accepting chemotaxis protein
MITGYEELNENITKTLDLIDNVTTASKEQSTGMIQINDAVNNLDKITQENAQNASQADVIAKKTLEISNMIIEHADAKDFDGKNSITIEKEENRTNHNFQNKENSKTKKRIKNNNQFSDNTSNDDWESF